MKNILGLCSLCFCQLSHSDLPLTVENLISDKGKFTLEAGVVYGNNKINDTKFGGYIPVQISDSSFINVPTNVKNEQLQNEYLITTLGAKYGLIKDLDINLRSNFIYNSNRFLDINSEQKSKSDTNLAYVSLSLNYQFLQDAKYPALVGFIETTLFEKAEDKNTNFSSWSFGVTTYRSYDPIVLSFTTGYKYSLKRKINSLDEYKPADLFFINPQLAFAANDRISLIAGLNFKTIGSQKLNSNTVEKQKNSIDYSFGIGFGLDDQSNLNVLATSRQDFNNSNEIRLNYNKRF
ncbi:hypothetical protein [Acinetobacter sp. 1125_18A]|uniref:hypothetical protein n=1 Tax=Acinetobacter sp. 1125_18A TaxID=2605959 RepID=UPI0040592B04